MSESENIIVADSTPTGSYVLSASGVYQYGSQLWVLYRAVHDNPANLPEGQILDFQYDGIEAFAPALAAEPIRVGSARYEEIRPLVDGGQATLLASKRRTGAPRSYDYAAGEGWVRNAWLGDFFLKGYPWVFSPTYGWLYVICTTPATDSGRVLTEHYRVLENAYWFFSPANGWLWAHQSAWPEVYSVAQGRFIPMPTP